MNYLISYLLAGVFLGCVIGLCLKLSNLKRLEQVQRELDQMIRGEARFPSVRKCKEIKP